MSFAQDDVAKARIYLAGFDVFRVDALATVARSGACARMPDSKASTR